MEGPLRENSGKEEKDAKNRSLELWRRKGNQKNPLKWAKRECSFAEEEIGCKVLDSVSGSAVCPTRRGDKGSIRGQHGNEQTAGRGERT